MKAISEKHKIGLLPPMEGNCISGYKYLDDGLTLELYANLRLTMDSNVGWKVFFKEDTDKKLIMDEYLLKLIKQHIKFYKSYKKTLEAV